jgi:chitodextrinase
LTATAASASAINLTWTASTDNVGVTSYLIERCQGAGCTTFTQVGTSTTTSFGDTGLTTATTYRYQVRATDAAANLSGYSNVASATTADSQAPTAPGTLTATAASASAINLTWTASTDNVGVTSYLIERCQGAGCTTFTQVGTSTTTSFGDAGLTSATTYRYRVRATDAAANLSGYSNVASATTPDTQAPTAPGTVSATAVSTSAINLTWTASSDNVGVTGYLIERCQGAGCTTFSQVGTSTTTSFGDAGLSAATTYRYQVRATDAAGNLSGYSNVATATTPAPPDTQAPSTPGALSGTATSSSQVALTWTASSDNVGVTGYRVSRNSTLLATVTTLAYADSGLTASTTYAYSVVAVDAAGNLSIPATTNVTTQAAPSSSMASDDFNRANVSPLGGNWSTWTGLGALRLVSNQVATAGADGDAGARWSGASFGADQFSQITIAASDGTPDSGPAVRMATGALTGYFTTSHNPNLVYIHKFANGGYTELGKTAGQYGTGDVVRLEAIGNRVCVYVNQTAVVYCVTDGAPLSGGSPGIFMYDAPERVDDWSGGDVAAAVTAPGTLTATAGSVSTINLTWTASTSSLGVAGYQIERCQGAGCTTFTQVGTATTTSFGDTGLTASTAYRYRVRASDGSGNLSGYSNVATATTLSAPDTQAPTAPGTPVPVSVTSTRINVSWAASTDNAGVTGYLLERCQGAGCSNFTQIATPSGTSFNDAGLSPSTSYSYRVRATDAAANLSAYSGEATGATGAPGAYQPVFVSEVHSSTDGCCGPQFNNATLNLNVTGTDRLLIVTWHSEWDGWEPREVPDPGAWSVTNNGVPGTVIAETNGYWPPGEDGNRRFRIYYWLNPPLGNNTIRVINPNTGANELAVAAMLFNGVDQTNPLGEIVLNISTSDRTEESETVHTDPSDLVVHVIGNGRDNVGGILGPGETSRAVVNDNFFKNDVSLWISTKPGETPTTTVSSSGWDPNAIARIINAVAFVLHGSTQ